MRLVPAVLFLAAVAPLHAQLQLFLVDSLSERPVTPVQDLGTIGRGDTLTTRFRLRNIGTAATPVRNLEVAGAGYTLGTSVQLPQTLSGGSALEFTVVFRASSDGTYSAVLRSESASTLLTVTVAGQLTIAQVTASGPRTLANGAVIDCGSSERGSALTVRFLLQNPTNTDQYLPRIDVTGPDFAVATPPALAVLKPLDETTFAIGFTPSAVGAVRGTLTIGSRTFALSGTGLEPPLPLPRLSISIPQRQSGAQGVVNILLSEKSRTSGSGTLTMEFRPGLAGAADPAVLLASGGRSVRFTVTPGDDRAYFGDLPGMPFQTGTTSGSLVFTLQMGTATDQQTVEVPAAPVGINTVQATHSGAGIEVRITGYDNVRTAGPLGFTFYDRSGGVIAPGTIRADSSADFGRYFQTSDLGGQFQLRAAFPVTGDASGIDSVEVELTNSAGSAKSTRTRLR